MVAVESKLTFVAAEEEVNKVVVAVESNLKFVANMVEKVVAVAEVVNFGIVDNVMEVVDELLALA